MNCRAAEDLIQRSLDLPLTVVERADLDGHLITCAACRRAWDEYRALSVVAADWTRRPSDSEAAPEEFTAQVLSRIAARAPAAVRLEWPRWVAFAACCVGVLLLCPHAALMPYWRGWISWLGVVRPSGIDLAGLDVWPWLRDMPQQALAVWNVAASGLVAVHGAALGLALALPLNAWLFLRAKRDARRTA